MLEVYVKARRSGFRWKLKAYGKGLRRIGWVAKTVAKANRISRRGDEFIASPTRAKAASESTSAAIEQIQAQAVGDRRVFFGNTWHG